MSTMAGYEYKTTSAEWNAARTEHYRDGIMERVDENIPDPYEPVGGSGWEMVGSAATERMIFWFWRRWDGGR